MIRPIANPTADVLLPGDMVAIYAGPDDVRTATIERPAYRDDWTPFGEVTLMTTAGRFDLPAGNPIDVVCWAPLPRGRDATQNGDVPSCT